MKKFVACFLSIVMALILGIAFPFPFSPEASGEIERIAVLDDEKSEYGGFCASISSEKVRFGANAYKSTPGHGNNEFWIIRTELSVKRDYSKITENGKSGALRFWIFIDNIAELNNWNGSQAQLGEGWDKNAYVWSDWENQIEVNGWNEIILPFSKAGHIGIPSTANITYFNLRTNNTTFKTTVYTDRICICTDAEPTAEQTYAMLCSCEENDSLSTIGEYSISSKHAYEGGFSFLSNDRENDSWIICSNGTSPLNAADVTPYMNGGLRFLIYVDNINAMGNIYRLALCSSGTTLGDYWANEDGNRTDTADVGYVWDSADIASQITKNGWNEVILPFKRAKENLSVTKNGTVYPYSNGINLTELYFRNYVRSCDVYIDSVMFIGDCENFKTIEPSYVRLSGLDEDDGRYTEGSGSLLLENETERFISLKTHDCAGDGFKYLRFMLYLPETGALPDDGSVSLYNGNSIACKFSINNIYPQVTYGWNEVFLHIRNELVQIDGISFSANTGYWHNIRIDSLLLMTAVGNDCNIDYKQEEKEYNNISSNSDFKYTVLNSCETADGMKKCGVAAATSEKRTEGSKSILSYADGDFILCSNGSSPLKPFNPDTYGKTAAIRLLIYIDGEVEGSGGDFRILITDGSATEKTFINNSAAGFYWGNSIIKPQIKKANNWNEIILPFSKADKNCPSEISCTDIYFYAAERTCNVYVDFITAVNDLSFKEESNSFNSEKDIFIIDDFNSEKPANTISDRALRFWIWIENKNEVILNWNGSQVQLGEEWDKNVYVWSDWDSQITDNGWNEIILPFNTAGKLGKPDNEQISYINIRNSNTEFKTTVYLDYIHIGSVAETQETYIDLILNDEENDSGGFCAEISKEKAKVGSFSYKATPGNGNHDYWMIRASLVKKLNIEKKTDKPYQGISSLYLSPGAEYKKAFKKTNLTNENFGGIQLWYRSNFKNSSPDGIISLAHGKYNVLSWKLADILSAERTTNGWESAYLSFESADGSTGYADTLIISANTELELDYLIFVSDYGDEIGEFSYCPTPGDANSDGECNILDLVRAKKHSAYYSALDLSVTDFDKDGIVSGSDISYLRKLIMGINSDILPVSSVNPNTPTIINSSDIALYDVISFGAKGDGITDDTSAFSAALRCAENTGATVYVPYGKYRLTSSLTVPENVSLKGQICNDGATPVLMLFPKTLAEGNKTPFFLMSSFSEVNGFTVWYPEQTLKSGIAKAYPYTFSMIGWQSVTLQNLYIVNAYDAFDFELTPHNLETVRNIKATVLHNGMVWSGNNDIGRFENISFSPEWWLKSNVPAKPDTAELYSWTRNNVTALHIKSIDWHFVSGLQIFDCSTGIKTDGGFGKFYDCDFIRCNTAVEFNSVAYYGTTFTDCHISATHGSNPRAIKLNSNCKNNISLISSKILSVGAYTIENSGATGVMLTGCSISNEKSAALYTHGGKYGVSTSDFHAKRIIEQSADAQKSTFSNVTLNNSAVMSLSDVNALVAYNNGDFAELPEVCDNPKQIKPADNTGGILNAIDYGVNEKEKDISSSLQSAINAAAESGGGTVFVPNGKYYLQSPILLKKGVTLLGSHDAPHYSTSKCTTFVTDYGKNSPDTTALITLEAGSALRGLSISYSETRLDSTPYAYTLRGSGADIYIRNIAVDGAYRVLDLKTNRCDRHYVEYLLFSATDTGISVGSGSTNGTIRDCQSNVSQLWDNRFTDRNYWLDTVGVSAVIDYLNGHLTGYEISDTVNQMFFMNFVYGASTGIKINNSANATIIGQGVDFTLHPITVTNKANITMLESQLSGSTGESVAVITESDFSGNLKLFNTAIWACRKNAMELNGGNTIAAGGVFFQGGLNAVYLSGGSTALYGIAFEDHKYNTFNISAGTASLSAAGNCYKNFSYHNSSDIKPSGCDFN